MSNKKTGSMELPFDWIGDQEEALLQTISLLKSPEEVALFFADLYTVEEIQIAAKRWCSARHLFNGMPQSSITEICSTSKNMVTRANREFIKNDTKFSKLLHERWEKAFG